jgi:4-aminobutyrate aminotransferase-like enzyme
MPEFRKLSQEEIERLKNPKRANGDSTRAQLAREYDEYVADLHPGEYVEVILDEGDNKLTVRKRLTAAANRRGLVLEYTRTHGPVIRFKVELQDPSLPQVEQEKEAELLA